MDSTGLISPSRVLVGVNPADGKINMAEVIRHYVYEELYENPSQFRCKRYFLFKTMYVLSIKRKASGLLDFCFQEISSRYFVCFYMILFFYLFTEQAAYPL